MGDLDPSGCYVSESGKRVPPLRAAPSQFVDRSIVIFGPSKTGKTVITKNIMRIVQGHIEQILVVSPSESSNRTYEGFVDPPLIHYRLYLADPANPKKDDGAKGALRFLEAVWKRQEMLAAIYTRANDPEVLARLFGRLPPRARAEGDRHIGSMRAKRARVVERVRRQHGGDPGRRDEKLKEVDEKFRQMLALLYKKYIAPHYAELWERPGLAEAERYTLQYLNLNPRLLLVFDDCAAELKPFFNKEVFRLLFYRNRHSFITVVIVAQDDTDLPTNLRKNAFVTFFTEPVVCVSNFERPSNKFPKPTREYVGDVAAGLFSRNRKLAYIREDEAQQHFYHVTFPYPRPFRFGSAAAHELCAAVQSTGVAMDKDNPYYDHFKI